MNIQILKTEIHQRVDSIQSEAALKEVNDLLASLSERKEQIPEAIDNKSPFDAEALFLKAVERYHGVLQKLAQ